MPYGEGYVLPDRYYDFREIGDGVFRVIIWEGEQLVFDDLIYEEDEPAN